MLLLWNKTPNSIIQSKAHKGGSKILMKTAKEITEYLTKEQNHNQDMQIHLVHIEHPKGYWTKMQTLEVIREFMLKFEYYPNKSYAMEGIKDALEFVLS